MTARRAALPHLIVFASGSNHAGEIEGFAAVGQHIGVAAPEVNAEAEAALRAVPAPVHVFVDSGAFSEVVFPGDGPPRIVKPITAAEWDRRLGLYERLAPVLRTRLHVVAPDQVGSQEVTLARLRAYAGRVRRIAATGAEVLVPLQRGALPLAAFHRAAAEALGWDGFVPAIPMKKSATDPADLAAYVRFVRPARVHLLGLGERNPNVDAILAALARESPQTVVSLDANKITASVGRQGAKLRVLTAATDYVEAAMAADCYGDAYTDQIGDPAAWLSRDALRKLAEGAGLDAADARAFARDPAAWLSAAAEDRPGDHAVLDHAIELAWRAHCFGAQTRERKRRAVRLAFGPELRALSGAALAEALHTAAIEDMQRPGTRTYVAAELLDSAWFRGRVEAACERALAVAALRMTEAAK